MLTEQWSDAYKHETLTLVWRISWVSDKGNSEFIFKSGNYAGNDASLANTSLANTCQIHVNANNCTIPKKEGCMIKVSKCYIQSALNQKLHSEMNM